ncbi:MAG: hypothetical protein JNK37_18090 [Verrucomicrobiales bacterium]|nr:hypothetical protein [Verrucomicrobiales bacterium]
MKTRSTLFSLAGRTGLAVLTLCCLAIGIVPMAHALTPQVAKLHSRAGKTPANESAGSAVAISDAWVLVGVPDFDPAGVAVPTNPMNNAGAVLVFDARTGRYLRTLTARDGDTPEARFGASVALCGNRAIVGAPGQDSGAIDAAGAAYVFDLTKGTRLMKLVSPTPGANRAFGTAVAISATQLAVSEPGDNTNRGAVHLYDAATGTNPALTGGGQKYQKLIIPPGIASAGDRLGQCLALAGRVVAAGAPDFGGGTGRVFCFDVQTTTGLPYQTLVPTGGSAAGDRFGASLAVDGPHLVAGAPGVSAGAGNAYAFNLIDGSQIRELLLPGLAGGDGYGTSVGFSGHLALIGAPGQLSGAGRVHLVDVGTGALVRSLTPPDGGAGDRFGEAVALSNAYAAIGAPEDDDIGADAGAAYYFRPLAGALPFLTLGKTGDFAPGVVDADLGAMGTPALSDQGLVDFAATLAGPGSNRGRDRGIWTNRLGPLPDSLAPVGKSRDSLSGFGGGFAGTALGTVSLPIFDQRNQSLFQATLTGTGVTTLNNRAIFGSNGTTLTPLLRTGVVQPALTGTPQVLSYSEVVQTRYPNDIRTLVPYLLNTRVGGATVASDSGVLLLTEAGAVLDANIREGQSPTLGGTFGQFFGRASVGLDPTYFVYPAFWTPAGGNVARQVLFAGQFGGNDEVAVNENDFDEVPTILKNTLGVTLNAKVQSFLGEGVDISGFALFRATIAPGQSGAAITKANNEGIWRESSASDNELLIQKGDPVLGADSGIVVARFLQWWPVDVASAVVLVKLAGRGVNTANDCAVILVQDDPVQRLLVLMREGDPVADWDCPRVGVIQRVEVDPGSGRYLILSSLTGASARNQGLFIGDALVGDASTSQVRRLPVMRIRKGHRFDTGYSDATTILALSLEPRVDRMGVGGKGLGSVLNGNFEAVFQMLFNNGAKEMVTGAVAY